jgi:uncharacterized protein YpiB (UPF0302 family)
MEKDTLDTAISLLCELHSMGCTEDDIKEVILQMWLAHTDEPLSISDINPTNQKKPEQNLSTYMQMYKIVDDTNEQDTYDIKGRIKMLDKLIDNALEARDRKAFTKHTQERNLLMLEL